MISTGEPSLDEKMLIIASTMFNVGLKVSAEVKSDTIRITGEAPEHMKCRGPRSITYNIIFGEGQFKDRIVGPHPNHHSGDSIGAAVDNIYEQFSAKAIHILRQLGPLAEYGESPDMYDEPI